MAYLLVDKKIRYVKMHLGSNPSGALAEVDSSAF
jgi:hypothetical protein